MTCRAALAGLLLAGAFVPQVLGRQQAPGPVSGLIDPQSGREAALPAGAALLHVVFFATWCPECMAELDALGDLEDRWSDSGYRLVLAAVRTRHTVERLAHFLEDRKPPGSVLFDAEGTAERRWDVQRVPTHLLIDASGVEIARAATAADAAATIDDVLARSGVRP